MANTPQLTVVLPAYREPLPFVKSAIQSVQEQTMRDFVCIVVLDDATNTVLQSYLEGVCKKDKRFQLLRNEKNLGLAATLNRGIAAAKTPYVARHDADDICVKERFELQLAYLAANPQVGLLFGGITYIDGEGNKKGTFIPQVHRLNNIRKHIFDNILLVHPTLMARTALMQQNQYDPTFRRSQDLELWLRLIGKTTFAALPRVLLYYRVPSNEDVKTRVEKVITWSRSANRALAMHQAQYKGNFAFWRRRMNLTALATLRYLPRPLVTGVLTIKDKFL